jgi:hypothetical protein
MAHLERSAKSFPMKKTTLDLQKIGASGGGMILDGKSRTTLDLQKIAASSKGTVIVKNADSMTTLDCQKVAASGSGRVIFDFNE